MLAMRLKPLMLARWIRDVSQRGRQAFGRGDCAFDACAAVASKFLSLIERFDQLGELSSEGGEDSAAADEQFGFFLGERGWDDGRVQRRDWLWLALILRFTLNLARFLIGHLSYEKQHYENYWNIRG